MTSPRYFNPHTIPNDQLTSKICEQVDQLIYSIELKSRLERVLQFESIENINRMSPVRLSTGSNKSSKKKKPNEPVTDYVSVPTQAEMDYYQNGLQLPDRVENLNKLLSDFQRTGRFDYELCYLLRKQEAQEDLKNWIGDVIKRRSKGDEDFGNDVTPDRFNHLVESSQSRVKTGKYFRDVFLRSLVNDIEN
jgi:hypothetical protein